MKSSTFEIGWLGPPTFVNFFEVRRYHLLAWSILEMESWVTMSDEKFNFQNWMTMTTNFCEFLQGKLERLTSGGTICWQDWCWKWKVELQTYVVPPVKNEKFNLWDWLTLTSNFFAFLGGQAVPFVSMINVGDGKLSYRCASFLLSGMQSSTFEIDWLWPPTFEIDCLWPPTLVNFLDVGGTTYVRWYHLLAWSMLDIES